MQTKTLFILSHDAQIDWYVVFAEAFKACGPEYRTVLLVHGEADARRGRQAGCYDRVVDLLEGFDLDAARPFNTIRIHPRILALEAEAGTSFLWEDLRIDRWARAREDPSYLLQYVNHAFAILLRVYEETQPVAALGEYTMALYRLAFRLFERQGRRMFYPITTRYYKRLYFETNLSWEWKACLDRYAQYLEEGIPKDLEREVFPTYERIVTKYGRPNYTAYQNTFATGYTQISRLSPQSLLRQAITGLRGGVDVLERERNLRYVFVEGSVGQKLSRVCAERRNHLIYERLTSRCAPEGLKYGVYFFHYQPEYTSDGLGRFYSDQEYLIKNIASSLPADTYLVVKEHPTMVGLRDSRVYRSIQSSPNVLLVHHSSDSVELIKQARIVFTIVGTPALEAMFVGKPAIMFGRYAFANTNLISFCADFWQLSRMIRDKLQLEVDPAEVRRHALALLAAKYKASRPGQIPIAVELIPKFLGDRENVATVKGSFVSELRVQGVIP